MWTFSVNINSKHEHAFTEELLVTNFVRNKLVVKLPKLPVIRDCFFVQLLWIKKKHDKKCRDYTVCTLCAKKIERSKYFKSQSGGDVAWRRRTAGDIIRVVRYRIVIICPYVAFFYVPFTTVTCARCLHMYRPWYIDINRPRYIDM
jgi:hypothetical protein